MSELPLLPNDTANEAFLLESGAVRCFGWILSLRCRPGGDWANADIGQNVLPSF